MQRYFVTSNNNEIIFSTDDIFHISVVMRNKINDLIEIVLDSNVYLAKIISFKPFKVEIVSKIEENHELNGFIRLILCSLRGDKNEFVIQKAVELGVKEIIIVESTRSVSKILDKKDSKLVRYKKIIKEAKEQSKRTFDVNIDIMSFKDINNLKSDLSIIPYEATNESISNLGIILNECKDKIVNVIIGPEGGFTKSEVEYCHSLNYKEVSLGRRILRSETASLFILSLLSYNMETK